MSEEPPPTDAHPAQEHGHEYGQPPPAYYAQQPAPTPTQPMANQQNMPAMATPGYGMGMQPLTLQSPGDSYKGFNACCCYTIDKGVKAVTKADISMSVLSCLAWIGFLFMFQLQKASTSTILALLIIVILLILLDLVSLAFSVIIMLSLNDFRKSRMWPPMAWIGTAILRTLLWIAFLAFWQPLLQPYDNYTVLEGTLLFRADELFFGYLIHLMTLMILNGWFVFVMLGYMRYKKVHGVNRPKAAEANLAQTTEQNPMTPTSAKSQSKSKMKV